MSTVRAVPDIRWLEDEARQIRRRVIGMVHRAKGPHLGCSFSSADIVTALILQVLRIDPQNPQWDVRDRFVLSKGHGVSSLYAALARRGFFPEKELERYMADGSPLAGHVVLNCVPGAESSNGSGGHGLSLGIGLALAARHKQNGSRTFVLMGDGEMEEGSVWEGIAFAGFHAVKDLTLIVDCNKLQTLGATKEIFDLEPLGEKFRCFRWDVDRIDGNNMKQVVEVLGREAPRPHAVLADTVKGKGVSYMEGRFEYHSKAPDAEQYQIALVELA